MHALCRLMSDEIGKQALLLGVGLTGDRVVPVEELWPDRPGAVERLLGCAADKSYDAFLLQHLDVYGYKLVGFIPGGVPREPANLNQTAAQIYKSGPLYGPVLLADANKNLSLLDLQDILAKAARVDFAAWTRANAQRAAHRLKMQQTGKRVFCENPACPAACAVGWPCGVRLCTRCRDAHYCSVDCQRADWPLHQHLCCAKTAAPK